MCRTKGGSRVPCHFHTTVAFPIPSNHQKSGGVVSPPPYHPSAFSLFTFVAPCSRTLFVGQDLFDNFFERYTIRVYPTRPAFVVRRVEFLYMRISFLHTIISIEKRAKEQSVLLVDSENIRHRAENHSPSFIDYPGLFNSIHVTVDKKVIYFAGLPKEASKHIRQKQANRIQLYRKNKYETRRSGTVQWDYKRRVLGNEKGVDVQMALDIVTYARKGVRRIYLASSDSDLLPAIKQARQYGAVVYYLFLENSENRGILQACEQYIKIPLDSISAFTT